MMDNVMTGLLYGLLGGGSLLIISLLKPLPKCPDCSTKMPRFTKPDTNQALAGGWTCPQCGCILDKKGKKVPASE